MASGGRTFQSPTAGLDVFGPSYLGSPTLASRPSCLGMRKAFGLRRQVTDEEAATYHRDGVALFRYMFDDEWIDLLDQGPDTQLAAPTIRARAYELAGVLDLVLAEDFEGRVFAFDGVAAAHSAERGRCEVAHSPATWCFQYVVVGNERANTIESASPRCRSRSSRS